MVEMVLFARLDELLYIQIKGEDDVWSLLSYNAYRSTFVFLGFADSCIAVTENMTREDLNVIYKHYAIKDKNDIDMLHNKDSKNLELSCFRLVKGALKNTGVYVENGELFIMENNACILEDVGIYYSSSTHGEEIITRTDTIKTSTGVLSLQTLINTVQYGWGYTLGEYYFEFNNKEKISRRYY